MDAIPKFGPQVFSKRARERLRRNVHGVRLELEIAYRLTLMWSLLEGVYDESTPMSKADYETVGMLLTSLRPILRYYSFFSIVAPGRYDMRIIWHQR